MSSPGTQGDTGTYNSSQVSALEISTQYTRGWRSEFFFWGLGKAVKNRAPYTESWSMSRASPRGKKGEGHLTQKREKQGHGGAKETPCILEGASDGLSCLSSFCRQV